MPLRTLQTAAESGNVFESTFTLYEENVGPYSANWQINSWTRQIPFHLHKEWEQMKTQTGKQLNNMTWSALRQWRQSYSEYSQY